MVQKVSTGFSRIHEGHVNAEIIGPKGLEIREDIIVGITLMRPGIITRITTTHQLKFTLC